jgi:hypothetical protein
VIAPERERLDMNRISPLRRFEAWIALVAGATSLILAWGTIASAAPRFADKDTALELAQALDKGVIRNALITSTFIQSVGRDQFVVKVVLDNGAEQDWDMHQIRDWSRDESLVLRKNRALLFPKEQTNAFVVLDKNAFATKALHAKVYAKTYDDTDVLAGQTIKYAIYQFNLVDLLNLAPGTDARGYKQHYLFDLENGQRELLTYLDAYNVMERNGLIDDAASAEPVMRRPYQLTAIQPRELQMVNGTGTFGMDFVFDRPIELSAGDFPFQLYERAMTQGSGRGPRDPAFVIEFTAPNAILPTEVTPISNLEFLQSIQAVADQRYQNRVLVRANLDPEVMNTPPEIEVKGQTVLVTFTKVQDQSVFDRKALMEAELRRRQDRMLSGSLTQDEIVRRNTYRQLMDTGLGQVDRARNRPTFQERVDLLVASLSNFNDAAVSASNDNDLEEAMRQRNAVMVKLPEVAMNYASEALKSTPPANKGLVQKALETTISLTREPNTLAQLNDLLRRIKGS